MKTKKDKDPFLSARRETFRNFSLESQSETTLFTYDKRKSSDLEGVLY